MIAPLRQAMSIQSPLLLLTLNLYTTLDKNAYHQYNNRPEFDAG